MDEQSFQIIELTTDANVSIAFDLIRQLRPHVDSLETFMTLLARQRPQGYLLVGGFIGAKLVVVAGFRQTCTLARGPHLFVDDLVTDQAEQGRGYGLAMIAWLRKCARDAGLPRVCLDSRDTAVGFYERAGFTFNTSRPCFIPSDE